MQPLDVSRLAGVEGTGVDSNAQLMRLIIVRARATWACSALAHPSQSAEKSGELDIFPMNRCARSRAWRQASGEMPGCRRGAGSADEFSLQRAQGVQGASAGQAHAVETLDFQEAPAIGVDEAS
ncbi:hypothetical protein [Thiomonas sp. FB-6]|uniref:hypothetical protein n=1 Tax=Thiomonas sp. FB-6 TaxID=1158291 RepID=UPI0018CAB577|nr:hypothetical protein [Thiomonas sp. FB-6]